MSSADLPADLRALLRAAREQPDDTPRLVLADWLEDYGGEAERARAELVRGQCRLAHLREGDEGFLDLAIREEELQARHLSSWLGPLAGAPIREWRCHRGLLH